MTGSDPLSKHDDQHTDDTLADGMTRAVKKMIAHAKERGNVTYDELNAVLPPDQTSQEQIEDTLAILSVMGIAVIDRENDSLHSSPIASDQEERAKGGQVLSMSRVPSVDEVVVDADGVEWCLQYLDLLRHLDDSIGVRENSPIDQ
jgi:uncharacterized protein YllA (UPF0747 family)